MSTAQSFLFARSDGEGFSLNYGWESRNDSSLELVLNGLIFQNHMPPISSFYPCRHVYLTVVHS